MQHMVDPAKAEAQKKAMIEQAQRKIDLAMKYNRVFSGPEGDLVLMDILGHCGILRGSFDAANSHVTAFNEGQRAVALRLMELLNLDVQKLKERVEKHAAKS